MEEGQGLVVVVLILHLDHFSREGKDSCSPFDCMLISLVLWLPFDWEWLDLMIRVEEFGDFAWRLWIEQLVVHLGGFLRIG